MVFTCKRTTNACRKKIRLAEIQIMMDSVTWLWALHYDVMVIKQFVSIITLCVVSVLLTQMLMAACANVGRKEKMNEKKNHKKKIRKEVEKEK